MEYKLSPNSDLNNNECHCFQKLTEIKTLRNNGQLHFKEQSELSSPICKSKLLMLQN